jgi:MOSC domain-containing protein YiiM
MTLAQLTSVNVVHEVRPGFHRDTAIDKRPVGGRVQVTASGLSGDRQMDSSHGGVDKAVYAYADEDAAWWAGELGREVPAGLFGENLRTSGLEVTGARIGECWRIGDVVLQVQMPRTPCRNLALRMGIDGFHLRFNATGKVGALLKVLTAGSVRVGDRVEVVSRPDHDVTIADLATGPTADQMSALLGSGVSLARHVREKARRVAARG